jgi:hypothetical protein
MWWLVTDGRLRARALSAAIIFRIDLDADWVDVSPDILFHLRRRFGFHSAKAQRRLGDKPSRTCSFRRLRHVSDSSAVWWLLN